MQELDRFENKGTDDRVKILIVDDDPDICSSLEAMLEMVAGDYDIHTAGNFSEARLSFKSFQPDIALVDIRLGGKNGLDLVPELKKESPGSVCIMMTAHRNTEYAVTALKNGADDYLFKPLKPVKILQTLERHVRNYQSRQLQEQNSEMVKSIYEQLNHMLFLLEPSGKLLDMNEYVVRVNEAQSKEELVGQYLQQLPCWKNQKEIWQDMKDSIPRALNGEAVFTEFKLRDRSGGEALLEAVIKRLQFKDKKTMIFVECRDVTETRRVHAELTKINKNLEKYVVKRTMEMVKTRQLAEKINSEKEALLSRMSQELRTPLNAVLGFSQLIEQEKENLPDHQKENLEEVLRAGRKLTTLIDNVLSLSALEQQGHQVLKEPLNIQEALKKGIEGAMEMARDKNVEIVDRTTSELRHLVHADSKFLDQIISHLLNNAIKFNRQGGRVTVQASIPDRKTIRVLIQDTGVGIEPEHLESIFNPFDRVEQNDREEGAGLGLPLVRRLVNMMDGDIGVESVPGEGSTFWFELPILETH